MIPSKGTAALDVVRGGLKNDTGESAVRERAIGRETFDWLGKH